MSEQYKKTFRGYLIDHHSPAPPTVDFSSLDVAEYERFYKEANISNLMLYTKDHWGYSYYDTKIGTKHPALTIDYIAEISSILRRNNIEFNAYYCLEYDTLAPIQHPEWAIRDKDGNAFSLKGRMAKWGMACYETGYRQYVLGQLAEVVRGYHPDSLFLDIFGKSLCYCDSCKAKFKARYGYDLPVAERIPTDEKITFDFGEKGHDVNAFLEDCAQEMLAEIIKTVKDIDPTIKVTINFAALYPKKIRDMLDYQFTEPWAGNWLSAAYSRDTAKGQYPQLGPGDVSEVYNYRPDSVYELAAAQIVANGCRAFFYSGSQHVDGTLEHVEAKKVGAAFAEVEQFEQYLQDRTVLADIAIVQSDSSSAARSGNEVVMNAIGRCKKPDAHRDALLGAMTLCDYSKYSWRVIPEQELDDTTAAGFRCIVLAGAFRITEQLEAVLRRFVANGGSLLADSACGLYNADGTQRSDFVLADLFGCRYDHPIDAYKAAEYGGYLKQNDNEIFSQLPDTLPPLGCAQHGVCVTDGTPAGHIVNPCTPLTDTTWVNWWCPPPKAEESADPALVCKGNVVYAAFDLFSGVNLNLNLHRQLFMGILGQLLPTPRLRIETAYPETISFVACRRGDTIVLHLISSLAEKLNGDTPPVAAGVLHLSDALHVRDAKVVYPVASALSVNANSTVQLPSVSIHTIVELSVGK